jgi:hypothetical protein
MQRRNPMTSFQTIRRCFVKLNAHHTLLILTFAAFQFSGANIWALPTVIFYGHDTDRFGPHSSPGWIPVGDKVQVFARLDSSDPFGSPTVSVAAVQGDTTLSLDPLPIAVNSIYEGAHVYIKFIDFDPGLTGSWEITPTDSTGTGPSTFTNAIADPEFLPLVEDVRLQGTPLGAQVSWTLPNLVGFDVDASFVSIFEAASGGAWWGSDTLPLQTTSFVPPPGVLQVGVDYVYGIVLADVEGSHAENQSWTFSEPFRYTIAGDFNNDGTVDTADYVVWRKGLGTIYTQNHYDVWRAHFGASLGTGSASTGYPLGASADPLSSAVPEPTGAWFMIIGAAIGIWTTRRVGNRPVIFAGSRLY